MRRVVEERQHIQQRAIAAKATEEALATAALRRRQAEETARAKAVQEQEARRLYAIQKAAEEAQAWETHPLHLHLRKRFGGALPHFLGCELDRDRGVYAHPAHWHSQLFYDLVLGTGRQPMIGRTVTVKQVYAMISQHFRLSDQPNIRATAITDYLHSLRLNGILDFEIESDGRTIGTITVVSDGLTPRTTPPPPQPSTPQPPSRPAPQQVRRAAPVPATHLPSLRQKSGAREKRWESAALRRTVLSLYPEGIPVFLCEDPTPDASAAIDALPLHWHAYLYLKYIHDRGVGYPFTLRDACETVVQHNLAPAVTEPVQDAVATYLHHLADRHRLLVAPESDALDGIYYVA